MIKLLFACQLTKRRLQLLWKHDVARVGLLYILALIVLYAPVVFLGRSLQAPLNMPFGVTDHGAYGYEGRLPVANFDVDIASPGYMEWPLSRLQGELLLEGELPLWNPYQGGGTPLAAQPDSRAFFPYQMLENVMPVEAQDYFLLGRLWFAGLFTFLFLRRLSLSWGSAFAGGLFFMFSGTFTIFINLEQMVNAAMVIPLLLWAVEGLWHWRWGRGVAALAIAGALVLLAGSPESAVYIFVLGIAYAIFRLVATPREYRWPKISGGLTAGVLGLALASVTLLPFMEFLRHLYSLHPAGGVAGVHNPTDPTFVPQVLMPILSRYPHSGLYYLHGGGRWDDLGGYIGILPVYLLLTGLVLGFLLQKSRLIKPLIFFAAFGLLILLKDMGFPPVSWIGHLPLLDQVWSNRWAGGTWTFSFAVAGAMGLEIIRERAEGVPLKWRPTREWMIFGGITGLILIGVVLVAWPLAVQRYPGYLISMAIIVSLAVTLTALFLTRHLIRTRSCIAAFAVLGLVELWFAIPMGYEPGWLWLRLLPVLAGLLAVFALVWQKPYRALLVGAVGVLLILAIDFMAPFGLPQRYDPASPPPYANFLEEHTKDYARITGGNGVLMPNFASLFHLHDVRYIGPTASAWYQNLHMEHLHQERLWPYANTSLWFTGYPDMWINSQGTGQYIGLSFWADIKKNLPWYSLLGVRYILDEPASSPPENIIRNGGFEEWDLGPGPFTESGPPTANFWNIDLRGKSSITVVRSKGEGDTGYAMAISYVHDKQSFVSYITHEPRAYLDQAITFSIRVKTDRARAVRCGIWTGSPSFSDYHPGDGQWHTLAVTRKCPQAPLVSNELNAMVVLDDSAVILLDDAEMWAGSPPPMYDLGLPLVYDNEVRIFENPDALPRVFVAYQVVYAGSYREAQRLVSQPEFNARDTVVLEETLPDNWVALARGSPASLGDSSQASIIDYQANRVTIKATTSRPGIMVLTDTYDAGWTAEVDGTPTPVYRTDGVFRGILLPEGEHTIVFNYFPQSYAVGCGLSIAALIICLALMWIRFPGHKNNKDMIAGCEND